MLISFAHVPLLLSLLFSGRLAIVASSSNADGQARLRYADRDADRMAEVLRQLGGFDNVWTLHAPRAAELRAALDRAEGMARADPHLELVFYFSGHANDRALLLGGESIGYDELRRMLEHSKAAVRVAVLDACQTGGATRAKGGQPTGEFSIGDAISSRVQGAAILAAATAGEPAQESSEIEGSYFTHHMLAALRGAADRDDNGLVTLAEAYEYAYGRTVAATLPTLWGPQHPSFDYRLTGAGQLVLTNTRQNGPVVWLPAGTGPVYYIATARNELVAEIAPHPLRRSRLALLPGRYRVVRRQGSRAFAAEVQLAKVDVDLTTSSFTEVRPELAMAKGRAPGRRNEVFVDVALAGLGPGALNSSGEIGAGWLRRGLSWSYGPHVSYGRAETSSFGSDYQLSRLMITGYALRRVRLAFSELLLGGAVGVSAIEQTFSGERHAGAGPVGLAVLALEVPIAERVAIRLSWGAGGVVLKVGGGLRAIPEARAALAVSFLY